MKTKTLILTIFFFYAFANVCDAQFNLGNLISKGITAGKAIKGAKKKQKELRDKATLNDSDAWSWQDGECTVNENQNENNDSITGTARNIETSEMSFPTKNTIANPKDEVALTVSADGATKEEATKIALRSAIEQAYGAFVSANTTILNDEMVKDEIVTISNGNIKSYQEVASVLLPNGRTTVTLNAIVSISKLTSYAQSKGATTEFAGATFAMNVKMMELNKQNEMKALDNLILQIKEILPTAFDLELIVDEPQLYSESNPFSRYNSMIDWAYAPASVSKEQYKINFDNYYTLPINITFKYNENLTTLWNLISSTLKSVEPSQQECDFFKNTSRSHYTVLGLIPESKKRGSCFNDCVKIWKTRLNNNEVDKYNAKINEILIDFFSDFEIIDNTGTKSSFDAKRWREWIKGRGVGGGEIVAAEKCFISESYYSGTGIFSPLVANSESFKELFSKLYDVRITFVRPLSDEDKIEWHLNVLIPKGDISKYSSFTIQHKSK